MLKRLFLYLICSCFLSACSVAKGAAGVTKAAVKGTVKTTTTVGKIVVP